jgi:hypothetical protein
MTREPFLGLRETELSSWSPRLPYSKEKRRLGLPPKQLRQGSEDACSNLLRCQNVL